MKIVAATQNSHKIAEIGEITKDFGMELISMADAGLAGFDIDETGSSFEENSLLKAEAVCRLSGEAAIADDSGLCVDALDGAPGIYSARFAGEHGDDAANRAKLLNLLKGVPKEERTARFVCAITLLYPDGRKLVANGCCEGHIAFEERGEGGFGYDCIFVPEGGDRSFGEYSAEEKNAVSHRHNALVRLRALLDGEK